MKIKAWMWVFWLNINPFLLTPSLVNLFSTNPSLNFLDSKNFVPMMVTLDQTLEYTEITRLIELGPTILPKQFIHDDQISRPMTHLLARFEYFSSFDIWVEQFDKLKAAFNCAALML